MTTRRVADLAAELADREAIRECLYRYCRGIDRCDAALLHSVYWPDATDEHAEWSGTAAEFVAYALGALGSMDQTHHLLGNIMIHIAGENADVESYVHALHRVQRPGDEPYDVVIAARYVDRMQRRDGEWRILRRIVIRDWFREDPDSADLRQGLFGVPQRLGGRHPDDRSYALMDLDG